MKKILLALLLGTALPPASAMAENTRNPAARSEDLQKFLNTPVWYLNYEVTLKAAGSHTSDDGGSWSSTVERVTSGTAQLGIRSQGPSLSLLSGGVPLQGEGFLNIIDDYANWIGGTMPDESKSSEEQDAELLSVMEANRKAFERLRVEEESRTPGIVAESSGPAGWDLSRITTSGSAPVVCLGDFALEIDAQHKTYKLKFASGFDDSEQSMTALRGESVVRIGAPDEFHLPIETSMYAGSVEMTSRDPLSEKIIEGPLPGSFGNLSGSPSYAVTLGRGTREIPGTLMIRFTLVPSGADEPVLWVEAPGYRDWLPRGKEGGGSGGPVAGASLPISAHVVSRAGRPLEAQKIRFELKNVTREPGVCINAPLEPPSNEPPDMSFEPGSGNVVVTGTERLVAETTSGPVWSADVVVSSFDFGAYALLEATAEVDGRTLVGHMVGEPPGTPITLPKCTGDSRVADAWRASMGIGAEPDDSDAESDPPRQAIPGDGLTVYEEYRGLIAKIGHLRLDPKRKELMLDDRLEGTSVDAEAVRGTRLFQQATGIQIWWLSRDGHKDRQINFNHGSAVQRKCDQHALVLELPGLDDFARRRPGEAARCVSTRNAPHLSPALVDRLVVFTDASGPQPAIDDRFQLVNIDAVSWAVAHELLHAVGVQHHGTGNRSGVLWTLQPEPWTVLEGGSPIDLRLESEPAGLPRYALDQLRQSRLAGVFPEDPITIAVQGGEMSGDQRCLMRYAGAPAYEPAGGNARTRVFVLPEERDAPGTGLCTSGDGTGVNAHDRPEGLPSRYGQSRTGGCAQQIRVSDVEATPAR